MKKLLIVCTLLLFGGSAFSQAWNGNGDQKVQAGLVAWGYGTGISGTYDYGLGNLVSVGAGVNFYFSNYKDNDNKNRAFAFGRVNAHLQEPLSLPQQWDIYPGIDLGVVGRDFGLGAHIGARYFFTDKFGAFVELGSHGTIGVSINL